MWTKIDPRRLVVLPALIVFLIYLPALGNGFVWDDVTFLYDLPLYRDPALWIQALGQPFVISPNYFRPLALLTFMAELRLGGLNPTLFHLTNLLLHALNTALVALLARHLARSDTDKNVGQDGTLALWSVSVSVGLLYGLHPALVEGVTFISSRFDLLLTAFLLLALLADVKLQHRVARPLAVGLAFLLAALTKEMAVALAFVLPLWHLALTSRPLSPLSQVWQRVRKAGDLVTYAALLVAGMVYLAIRYATLGYLLLPQVGIATGTILQHLLLVGRSLMEYVLLILWPFTALTPIHYSPLPIPANDPAAWVSLVAALVLAAGLVKLVQVAPRSGWLAVAGTLSLLPVINVLPLDLEGGAFIAERFLLFPLTLFSLAVVPLLVRWQPSTVRDQELPSAPSLLRSLAPWLLRSPVPLLLWLAASVVTIQVTLPHWRDSLALWTWTARRAPLSPTPLINLAQAYSNQGDYPAGLEAAQRALNLDPTASMAWNNAGLALFHLERYAEAQAAFEQAVSLEPQNALFWNNLAGALMEQDQQQEAERILLDEALRRNPTQPLAHLNLGALYLRADRPDLAVQYLQEALRLLPPVQTAKAQALLAQTEEPERWLRLGDLLLTNGDPQGALRAFEQAGALGAQPADVAVGQSAALIGLEAWSQAEAVLQEALQQAPDDARLCNNLGVVALEQGNLDAAQAHFARAVTLAPEWDLPRQNLADLESQLAGATPQP